MYLRLQLAADINVTLRVRGYQQKRIVSEPWCVIDLTVKKQDVLNYELYEDESLDCCEIRHIIELIENVLNGIKAEHYEPLEPYMVFESVLKTDSIPAHLMWQIYLWSNDNKYNSESTISLYLEEDDMKALLAYLKFVTGELGTEEAQALLEKQIFIEDDGKPWMNQYTEG